MNTGILLINKPSGPTSHDIVDAVRRITGIRTVGHAGTLDPFASGLLIVGVGREATKRLDQFKQLPKTYIATLRLGATSDTDDRTGHIVGSKLKAQSSKLDIENVLKSLVGEIDQIPPMYSAKKIKGKKLYELARQGKTIERKSTKVTIYSIKLIDLNTDQYSRDNESTILNLQSAIIEVSCSSGTYIRALARDIGEKLGCGAYCEELIRTAIGQYKLDQAVLPNKLTSDNWQSHIIKLSTFDFSPRFRSGEAGRLSTSAKVLVFGTFDRLHPGHLDFFRQAKKWGGHLIVGIGRDAVVAEIKGRPAREDEQARLAAVESSGLADKALLLPQNPEERYDWIKKINPDIIALGYDQTAFTENLEDELHRHGLKCRVVKLKPYFPEKYKSSKQV